MTLPRSLQGRLLVLVLGVVAAIWLGAAVATWLDARHELDELFDSHLAQAAALLVVQQTRSPDDDDEEPADAPTLHRYAPKVAFQVWHEGTLVLRSANAPATPMSRHGQGFETQQLDGTAWRVFATRGAKHDVLVYVGERSDSRDRILWAVMRGLLWPLAIALPVLALAGWWAVRQGLAPLRRLGDALSRRSAAALEPVILPDATAEMAPMVEALNGLFGRIKALLESERRFTADAAHELRTPIAAIRAQAQVALVTADGGARRHALQNTLVGCDRAANVVEQLMTLSRLESGAQAAANAVDLAAVARRVVADLAGQALDKGQVVELEADRPCPVNGEETLIAVLVRNLVDNAIRYSPPGARVCIGVAPHPRHGRLTVEDSGPGLTDEQQARLGERFYRVLGTGQSGSGLGWSIVRRIASAHGAAVEIARSARLGGLSVTVIWPAPGTA